VAFIGALDVHGSCSTQFLAGEVAYCKRIPGFLKTYNNADTECATVLGLTSTTCPYLADENIVLPPGTFVVFELLCPLGAEVFFSITKAEVKVDPPAFDERLEGTESNKKDRAQKADYPE